jgi:hypothetical protein
MARSKNDPHKRKAAQGINHLAAAILDIHEIYTAFEAQAKMLQEQLAQYQDVQKMHGGPTNGNAVETGDAETIATLEANAKRYEFYTQELYTIMMGVAATREHIIFFIGQVWNLDEESVKVYMG